MPYPPFPAQNSNKLFAQRFGRSPSGLLNRAARTAKQRKQYHARKKGIEVPGNHFEKPSKNRQTPRKHIKKTAVAHAKTRCNGNIFYFGLLFFASGLFVAPSSFLLFPELRTRKTRPFFFFCASFYTQFFAYFLLIFYAATRFALFVIRFRDSSRTVRESSGSAR